ncbi:Mor transcription activator family protein [Clostridium paraputrificum]|uniref:Mor transcription activator family protein n=1 Tax=Clostridium paraputrificum TaxID=29363 RepID=UPI002330EC90|nr:Mor transcription activator family protein [Clostridium paraputrificum]MDB2105866.1 Mor transcription activator family protein [Clostridium paraputrificum]MDB2112742.1 Mor transcription activator family protein [Clostridium paraputrificum]
MEMMEKDVMSKKSENYRGIYKDMVDVLGVDVTLKIYESYKGQQVTFPMRLYSDKYVIDYLSKNYNGKNLNQISRKLGYTCNWLQKVINKNGINKMERGEKK